MSQLHFQLDENVDVRIVSFLEKKGYSVFQTPKGLKDKAVAELAKEQGRTLLTIDRDFANTDVFKPSDYGGIVVFMIHPPRLSRLEVALERLLNVVPLPELKGKLFLVSEDEVEVVEG